MENALNMLRVSYLNINCYWADFEDVTDVKHSFEDRIAQNKMADPINVEGSMFTQKI
jgi:hypothetical protein